jgi:hypothetical protein
MKDTIQKNKRRNKSFQIKEDHQECWKISMKYSGVLIKNITSGDLGLLCDTVYGQYLNELESNNLNTKSKNHRNVKNYVQIWDTMINTVRVCKGNEISSIRLLHQTNCQRVA